MQNNRYYTQHDAASAKYFRIPEPLITNPKYRKLSDGAKITYAILTDRFELSQKNGWYDDQGRIYFIFSDKELAKVIGRSTKTANRHKQELVEFGLIEMVQVGLNQPNVLYLLKPEWEDEHHETENPHVDWIGQKCPIRNGQKRPFKNGQKRPFKNGQKRPSKLTDFIYPDKNNDGWMDGWERSALSRFAPTESDQKILDAIEKHGYKAIVDRFACATDFKADIFAAIKKFDGEVTPELIEKAFDEWEMRNFEYHRKHGVDYEVKRPDAYFADCLKKAIIRQRVEK